MPNLKRLIISDNKFYRHILYKVLKSLNMIKVCNVSLEPYNMKNHIKGKHFLSMLQYKSNFGEIEFVREVYHR